MKEFILSKIKAEKGYYVINGASMEPIRLKEALKKNGTADTDQDGLSDRKEVDWESIKVSGDTITLPTLYDTIKSATKEENTALDRFGTEYLNQIKELEVLPILSDPTKLDSDGDGVSDFEDEYPLDKEMTHFWVKLEGNGQVSYLAQGKEGNYYSKMILVEEGATVGQVHQWTEEGWEDTGKKAEIPEETETQGRKAAKKNYKDAILNELTNRIRKVENKIKTIFTSKGYDFNMSGENWKQIYLGAVGGLIDSCVKDENFWQRVYPDDGWDFAKNLLNPIRTLRPSSSRLKHTIYKIYGKTEKELSGKYNYQKAKSDMEFIVYGVTLILQYGSLEKAEQHLEKGVRIKGNALMYTTPEKGAASGSRSIVVTAFASATMLEIAYEVLVLTGLSLLLVFSGISQVRKRALDLFKEDVPDWNGQAGSVAISVAGDIITIEGKRYKCDTKAEEIALSMPKNGHKYYPAMRLRNQVFVAPIDISRKEALAIMSLNNDRAGVFAVSNKYARGLCVSLGGAEGPEGESKSGYWMHYHGKACRDAHCWFIGN